METCIISAVLCVDTKYFTYWLARVPLYPLGDNPGVSGVFPWLR